MTNMHQRQFIRWSQRSQHDVGHVITYVEDRPVSPEAFGATLYNALGVPPETRLGPDGFSFRLTNGEALQEIFS